MTALDHLRIAMELAHNGRIDDALAGLDSGLCNGGDPHVRALLARSAALICAQANRHDKALVYYEMAATAEPDDPYTELAIGDVHAELGRRDEAEAHWKRFVELALASGDPALLELVDHHRAQRGTGA